MTAAAPPRLHRDSSVNGAPAANVKALAHGLAAVVLLSAAVAGLYLIKSALGINLLPGHSPLLHATLYPLVRG